MNQVFKTLYSRSSTKSQGKLSQPHPQKVQMFWVNFGEKVISMGGFMNKVVWYFLKRRREG